MPHARPVVRSPLLLAAVMLVAQSASATTLVHRDLDRLVQDNELVMQARVLDLRSYWNPDHSFILTDVHVQPTHMVKGPADAGDVTFTIPGGVVDDVTILLVGGPDLVPGSDYVLFLTRDPLPGVGSRLTVRDQSQGVFEVTQGRAFSQALGEHLVPDPQGRLTVPGGDDGFELGALLTQLRGFVNR